LTLNLRVPVADVLYTPTATEVLKEAWIKCVPVFLSFFRGVFSLPSLLSRYLSVFVVLYLLLDRLCAFVFYFQLLPTTMAVDDDAKV